MTIPKSAYIGVAVAVVAYGGMYGLGKIQSPSLETANVADGVTRTATPTAMTAKPLPSGAKTTANKIGTTLAPHLSPLAPTLAPVGTTSPVPTITPRVSASPTPSVVPSPTATATPTPTASVTPNPTATPVPSTPPPTPIATATPTPTLTPTPAASALVVINEVAWMGTATSSNDEWMELYNAGDTSVDLTGWTLAISAKTPIALSGTLGAHAYYLLERTNDSDVSDISADYIYTGALADAGEVLVLRDATGTERDRIASWYAGTKAPKASMERIDPTKAGTDLSNWGTNTGTVTTGSDAAGQPLLGTPKYKNSVTL